MQNLPEKAFRHIKEAYMVKQVDTSPKWKHLWCLMSSQLTRRAPSHSCLEPGTFAIMTPSSTMLDLIHCWKAGCLVVLRRTCCAQAPHRRDGHQGYKKTGSSEDGCYACRTRWTSRRRVFFRLYSKRRGGALVVQVKLVQAVELVLGHEAAGDVVLLATPPRLLGSPTPRLMFVRQQLRRKLSPL